MASEIAIELDARLAALEQHCSAIVGLENVRTTGPADAVAGIQPRLVVTPGTEQELAAVLCAADEKGLTVVPRGGGTKLGWGNLPARADVVLSTARLNRVVAHAWADMTATVQAGCTVARLQQALAEHGQRLAVDALWPERATIGGILATNDSGALRLRYGGLRDLIIGVTIALPDGTLASSGGRVVKNVAGYDLQKLSTGAMGTLGIITQATFRVHPLPLKTRTRTLRVANIEEVQRIMLAIQDSQVAHSALQVRLGSDADTELDVLLEGTEAGIAWQETTIGKIGVGAAVVADDGNPWDARERLFGETSGDASVGVAKLSILPAELETAVMTISQAATPWSVRWRAVIQATGLGCVRLQGGPESVRLTLLDLRRHLQLAGDSLAILRQPPGAGLEAWGDAGDALPLMQALKAQLDPHSTLNPGRFVGGI